MTRALVGEFLRPKIMAVENGNADNKRKQNRQITEYQLIIIL
jgi:hypothetical protein